MFNARTTGSAWSEDLDDAVARDGAGSRGDGDALHIFLRRSILYVVFGFNNVTLVPEGISGLRKEADCF